MIEPPDGCFTFSRKPCQHQAERGAQVGGHHLCARQCLHTFDDCRAALCLNICAHARKFRYVHVTVLEYGLFQHTRAFCLA